MAVEVLCIARIMCVDGGLLVWSMLTVFVCCGLFVLGELMGDVMCVEGTSIVQHVCGGYLHGAACV